MMLKGGRRRDPLWDKFNPKTADNKVSCKECKQFISAKIERLKSHTEKCRPPTRIADENEVSAPMSFPHSVANQEHEYISPSNSDLDAPAAKKRRVDLFDTSPTLSQKPSTSHTTISYDRKQSYQKAAMKNFIVKTSEADRASLRSQWAKVFYKNRLPFSLSEDPDFQKAIDLLRPGMGRRLFNQRELAGKFTQLDILAVNEIW